MCCRFRYRSYSSWFIDEPIQEFDLPKRKSNSLGLHICDSCSEKGKKLQCRHISVQWLNILHAVNRSSRVLSKGLMRFGKIYPFVHRAFRISFPQTLLKRINVGLFPGNTDHDSRHGFNTFFRVPSIKSEFVYGSVEVW